MLLFCLVFCALPSWPAASRTAESRSVPAALRVRDAFIRGLPPGQTVTAAFMKVINDSDTAFVLTGARTVIAREVQMHEVKMAEKHGQNGMAGMRQRESVTIAPHSAVTFAPGGLHLMLIDLTRAPREGERIDMTLQFNNAPPLRVPFLVRSVLHESAGMQRQAR